MCQALGILSRQPFTQQPLFLDVIPLWGTSEEAKGQAMLSGPLSLYPLYRREPLKACEQGSDLLRAVEWAQNGLEKTQGKD